MQQFLSLILSYPTAPLTVAMGVVLLYWVLVIVGIAGHDLFDGGDSVTGAVKAVTGAAKAVGAAKAAGGPGHGHDGADTDGGLLTALGLGKVPITITGSSMIFFAWVTSLFSRQLVGDGLARGSAVLLGSLVLSLFATALALKPVAKVFEPAKVASRSDIVGHICTVTSTKVNATFGTATLADGGAGLLLNVVCGKENGLAEGDRAVIVQWDEQNHAFEVEPVDWLEPGELEALKDPERARDVIASRVKVR